ncbi:MBL fold metallo-hydrolase [Streptomyces sp. NPDC048172]|uniref:MBL fold metallo-hydrolase n=1 Tax=Streptomyces sp. NPDC048172 TaxID=3365505 RepID=UPI00371E1AD8
MRVHHLNCGSMLAVEPVGAHGLAPLPVVCHCLLIETETSGLVLVETGFGLADTASPAARLGEDFLGWARPRLDPAETALRQVTRLGHRPEDVRHIFLTHLHRDHTGGLPDFPDALVHVHEDELAAVSGTPHPHWAHGPRWSPYATDGDERWHGFTGVRPLPGLPADILAVPLAGHTPGHTALAVRGDAGWLLHAGDAYYFHGELRQDAPAAPPLLDTLQEQTEADRDLRLTGVTRLGALAADPASGVRVVSAHDPWEFRALAQEDPADPGA